MSPRLPSARTSSPRLAGVARPTSSERRPAGGAEALEAGELRLDRDDRSRDGVDHGAAVGQHGRGARGRRRPRTGGADASAAGPQPRGVGIEPDDDLRLAPGDEAGQPVGEVRTGWTLLDEFPCVAQRVRARRVSR